MKISKICVGELQTNCYLLEKGNEALLIDPGAEYKRLKKFIKGKNIVGILLTHHHFDHIGCVNDLVNEYNLIVYDNNSLNEGINNISTFTFEVIKTYGHTMDSISFYFSLDKVMFTGDFLFYDTIGRCDFIESDIDIYCQHYTLFDNPFLPKEYVEQLCKEYAGTVYYNRYILGQWCNAEGIIFSQIADNSARFITDKLQNGFISLGIDWGGNGSKHSITATRISRDYSTVQVLKSDLMEAKGTDTKKIFKWIVSFVKEIITTYGSIVGIYCDSAEQVLNNSLSSELITNGLHIPILNSVKTEITSRIEMYNILLNTDRLTFLKDKTKTIIEALQTALYDEKADKDVWLDDGTSDIDSLDSFTYSFEYWFPQLSVFRHFS